MNRYLLICLSLWLFGCTAQQSVPLYHQMDQQDVALANQALAEALQTRPKGQSLTWFNPATATLAASRRCAPFATPMASGAATTASSST